MYVCMYVCMYFETVNQEGKESHLLADISLLKKINIRLVTDTLFIEHLDHNVCNMIFEAIPVVDKKDPLINKEINVCTYVCMYVHTRSSVTLYVCRYLL